MQKTALRELLHMNIESRNLKYTTKAMPENKLYCL